MQTWRKSVNHKPFAKKQQQTESDETERQNKPLNLSYYVRNSLLLIHAMRANTPSITAKRASNAKCARNMIYATTARPRSSTVT